MKKLFLLVAFLGCLFSQTLQEIQDSKTIRIGVRKNLPPFSNQDSNGNMSGFEVDLAKALAVKLIGNDANIDLVAIEAKDRVPMLVNDQLDLVVANLVQTPEREKSVDFSVPYLSSYLSVLSKKGSNISKVTDLNGKRILYIPGTTTEEFKNKNSIKAEWVECMHVAECHNKIKDDEADAYMHINILIAFLPFLDTNVELGIKKMGDQGNTGVAVKKGNKELLDSVNKAIYQLSKENFFKDQFANTLDPFYRGSIDKHFLLLDDLYNILNF